jgi:hypothetical protein
VTLLSRKTVTGSDGWYRIDFGCPPEGIVGFNTTFIDVSHPAYADRSEIVGRGRGHALIREELNHSER